MSPRKTGGSGRELHAPGSELIKSLLEKGGSDSLLGDWTSWPQSVLFAVNVCLNSQFPLAVWLPDGLICVYNEAFRDLLHLKNPQCFGKPGAQLWPDFSNEMEPFLKHVLSTGSPSQFQKQFSFSGSSAKANVQLSFNNSPIYEAPGKVSGVFTTVSHPRQSVPNEITLQELEDNEARLRMAIECTNLGTWDYNPLNGQLNWSDKCQEIYAIPKGQKIDFETFAKHIHPDDRAFVEAEISDAMDPVSGGNYDITYRILRFVTEEVRWIRAQGKVYFNSSKQAERFIGTVVDVTTEREYDMKRRENELKMELTMRASEMGSFEWHIKTSRFEYSDRMAQIFGFNQRVGLTHQDFRDRIHPDDRHIRQAAHEEAFQSGVLFYEARVIWPDNTVRWGRFNGHIIFDDGGQPEKMYGTALDITESHLRADAMEEKVRERTYLLEKKNEELKRSEERYTRMTEEVQDYAIILLDRDGTILNWNRGAEKIKGYTEDEIIGQNFSIFYLDNDRKANLPGKLIRTAVEQGRAMHEGFRKRKDGTAFWGSIVITALHDDDDNVIGFTKVTRDLTERKIAEDLMKQHTAELEIKNKQLEQFAYIASHDLQEPLRKIQTFVQIVEKKMDDVELRQTYFLKINSSAKRMADLIQSVLNYSRLSQMAELWVPTDLNTILQNVLTDYELMIAERNAVIKYDVLPQMPVIPLQISQLFANLIGNSLKFSIHPPRISITSRIVTGEAIASALPLLDPMKNYAELVFNDNGIGFEQRYSEKIFTIFQRLNSREEYSGTGIGLALCKKIVDNHQGHIFAKSQPGEGSTFFVYLPYK